MKKIIYILLGGIMMMAGTVYALPYYSSTQTILPFVDNSYDLGTSTKAWRNLYLHASDGCATFSSNQLTSTGSACGSGGGGTFPFTSVTGYNSTSTPIGFLQGLFSTASSTFSSNLYLSSLGQGFLYTGTNGLVSPIASSSVQLSWFNNDAGFLTSYTSPFEIATTSGIAVPGLAYFTKTSGRTTIGSVSTSTLTASSPLTGSFTQVGSGGSLGLDTSGTWSGTAGSVTAALTAGTGLTSAGTYNGSTARTFSLDTANSNTWSVLQNFNYSSSTIYSSFLTSSSTFGNIGTLTLSTSTLGCAQIGANGTIFSTGTACGSSSGLTSYDAFTHPSAGISATTSEMNMVGLLSTASSTFLGATTTFNNGIVVKPRTNASVSVSVGGSELHDYSNTNAGMYLYTSNTGANGALMSLDCNADGMGTQCFRIQSANTTQTVLNIQGLPIGLGVIKVSSQGDQGVNGSLISLDSTTNANTGQGLFIKQNSTSDAINVHDSGSNTIFEVTANGLTNMDYSSSTIYSSFIKASSTNWFGGGLGTCNGSSDALTWSGGFFGCHSITASGGSDPFTHTSVYGQTTSATSTLLALTGSPFSLVASSTVNFVNASTTQLTVSGWYISTSTTVCISPQLCQYQATSSNAEFVINQAINSLSGGGTLYLLPGTYNESTSSSVVSLSNISIVGSGENTIIKVPTDIGGCGANSVGGIGLYILNSSNITVQGIHFDGTNQCNQNDVALKIRAENASASNVKVIGNTFTNIKEFAVFPSSKRAGSVMSDVLIEGNNMYCNSGQDCIGGGPGDSNQTSTTTNVSIIGNTIVKSSGGGTNYSCIDPTAITNLNIQGNVCQGSIRLDSTRQPNSFVNISNNIVQPLSGGTIGGQIIVDDSNDAAGFVSQSINITNNTITAGNIYIAGDSGANLQTKQVVISGNNIQMPPAGYTIPFGNINYGMDLNYLVNAQVSNNIIATSSASSSKGIVVTNSTYTAVSGNTIKGTNVGVDLNSGTGNTTKLNNYISITTNEANAPNSLQFSTSGVLTFPYSTSTIYSSFSIASTTNLFAGFLTLSTSTAGCLATNSSGVVFSNGSPCGTSSGLTSYDAFTHPAVGVSATTSELDMVGFVSTASSTVIGNFTDALAGNGIAQLNDAVNASAIWGINGGIIGTGGNSYYAGTGNTNLVFSVGGTRNSMTFGTESMRVLRNFKISMGTSTPSLGLLTIASSTVPQLMLGDGVSGDAQWSLRNAGGNLYFATTTVAGTATSTSFMSILNSGSLTLGTTTPWLNSVFTGVGTTTIQGQFATLTASTTASATQNINWSSGNTQTIMLTAATSIVVNSTSSNPIDGGKYVIQICQDPTGSRTLTWANPIALRWWNGTTTITSTANKCTFIGMIYTSHNGNNIYSIVASSTNIDIR